MFGNISINACNLCVVCGNRALLDGTLLGELIGDFAVTFELGKSRAIFIGIGVFRVFKNGNANLNVYCFTLKCANILKCLGNVCLKLTCLCG